MFIMRPYGTTARSGLCDLINTVKKLSKKDKINIIEVGSYSGESTEIFFENGIVNKIFCIDAWKNDYDSNDIASTCTSMDEIERIFHNRTFNFRDNVIRIKERSDIAVNFLNDLSFDMVYIDALHTYDGVKSDINLYKSKIKLGGFICGHDYDNNWKEVIRAVDETLGKPEYIFDDFSWMFIKK